jgi:hypothetical protein
MVEQVVVPVEAEESGERPIVRLRRKPSGAMVVVLANGDEAPVGRTFIPGLRALLREMEG